MSFIPFEVVLTTGGKSFFEEGGICARPLAYDVTLLVLIVLPVEGTERINGKDLFSDPLCLRFPREGKTLGGCRDLVWS